MGMSILRVSTVFQSVCKGTACYYPIEPFLHYTILCLDREVLIVSGIL